ncbi:MAG TPA: apolipoprotein N-acyltransferase [Gammaproteobacteria bacterium]|nr:apolipoprotein N-acyltransferase [Gammaproteobacteria bacterium]
MHTIDSFFGNAKHIRDSRPIVGHSLALLSGALFPLAFSPFDIWWMGIASLVIFLFSLDVDSKRAVAIRYYLFSVGMYGIGVSWIFVSINVYGGASYFLAGILITFFVLSYSLTSLVAVAMHINVSNWLIAFPAIWVMLEWFRSWFLTGFPWLFAGYIHLDSPLSGFIAMLGVLGLGLLTALTAVLLYSLRPERWVVSFLALGVLWGGGAFLAAKVSWVQPTDQTVSVSAVQGNIDQHTKWLRKSVGTILNTYLGLTESEWGRDIIVWPEAAITVTKPDAGPILDELARQGHQTGTTLILGIPDRKEEGGYLNSALAVGNGAGDYQKRRLVPFGEYVPLEEYLRGLITFFDLPMSRNHSGPMSQDPLLAGLLSLSLSICYEVVYPELVRETVEEPDLFVTISNDTWFGNSLGPKQHLQMARMRAAENGRWMIRSTNNGITALIDHQGTVQAQLPSFKAGVLRGEVRVMQGATPYHRFGHWPVVIPCLFFVLVLLVKRRILQRP